MHLSIKDQTKDGKPAIMCIEKPIRTCIILSAKPDEAETLHTLAAALGVTKVYILASSSDVTTLREAGWTPADNRVLLSKKSGGK